MKTNFKVIALVAALLVAPAAVFASDPAQPAFTVNTVRAADGLTMRFYVQKAKQRPAAVLIQLKNSRGDVFFEQNLGKREPGKALSLNLSQLPDGQYTFVVSGAGEEVSKSFSLNTPDRTLAMK